MKENSNKLAFTLIVIFVLSVIATLGFLFLNSKGNLFPKQTKNKAAASQNYEVSVYKDKFFPATIRIKKGSQVTWTNKDTVNLRMVTDPYPANNGLEGLDSGSLRPNTSFSFLFDKAGNFTYHQEENPLKIKGVVIVE